MNHEELVEAAKKAINAVFSDRSVSNSITRESLEDLSSDIDAMLDTLSVHDDEE